MIATTPIPGPAGGSAETLAVPGFGQDTSRSLTTATRSVCSSPAALPANDERSSVT